MKKIGKYLRHPSLIKEWIFYKKMHGKHAEAMSDAKFLSKTYKHKTGKTLNLHSPQTFNEKLQWIKINDRKPLYTDLCDKIKVKEIISDVLGPEFVVPNIFIYDKISDINFDALPNKFVLKCNHDSGSTIVVRNKNNADKNKIIKKISEAIDTDYFYKSREWPYKDIKRKVFAEQYIESEDGTSMVDYKFYCFNGVPKFLYVSKGLEDHSTASISFFDLNGKRMPFKRSDFKEIESFELPKRFPEMIGIAEKLAKFSTAKFIRIDLYTINGKIYFSEFTFFPCGGFTPFEPESTDLELGKMLNLGI